MCGNPNGEDGPCFHNRPTTSSWPRSVRPTSNFLNVHSVVQRLGPALQCVVGVTVSLMLHLLGQPQCTRSCVAEIVGAGTCIGFEVPSSHALAALACAPIASTLHIRITIASLYLITMLTVLGQTWSVPWTKPVARFAMRCHFCECHLPRKPLDWRWFTRYRGVENVYICPRCWREESTPSRTPPSARRQTHGGTMFFVTLTS